MPTTVYNSTQLRNIIQGIASTDPIVLDPSGTFSVLTLGKLSSFTPDPVPFTGYTIQGPGATLTNTRIYQNNVESAYSPNIVKGDPGNPLTFSYSLGGAADSTAILRSTLGTYNLDNLVFTGQHSGWQGNSNLYMSIGTSNNGNPVTNPTNVKLTLSNSLINITGQAGFNPATGLGGSAFLHSFDNKGDVNLLNNTFDEAGFLSSFNLYNQQASTIPNRGLNTIGGNLFTNTLNPGVVRRRGSRLTNVAAYLYDNTFENGAFLDVFGNVNDIIFDGTNSLFKTIANGYGIRANYDPVHGDISGSVKVAQTATITFDSVVGLPLKYVNPNPNQVFYLDTQMDGGEIHITNSFITDFTFYQAAAGGQAGDLIIPQTGDNGTNTHTWAYGDDGNDTIHGGTEEDFLDGGAGDDLIESFAGLDTIVAGTGNDTIYSGAGDDRLFGGGGNDLVYGEGGTDVIQGDDGNDTIYGGDGNDTIYGGNNNDSLFGELNNDILSGDAGNDTLNGGVGADTLTGGSGVDLFVWSSNGGTDRITDFSTATEQVGIPDFFPNTSSGATLNTLDFTTANTILDMNSTYSNKVTEIQSSQTTSDITTSIPGLLNAYALVYNSSLVGGGRATLYYDNDWADNTPSSPRQLMFVFNNITTLSGVTAFTNSNFLAI